MTDSLPALTTKRSLRRETSVAALDARRCVCCLFLANLLLWSGNLSAAEREFLLHAGDFDRTDFPVHVDLPAELAGAAPLRLVEIQTQHPLTVQRSGETRAVFLLEAALPAGQSRRYRLSSGEAPPAPLPRVSCREESGLVMLQVDGQPVLTYHAAVSPPPSGLDPRYRRSGHIHPVVTPAGRTVTEEFPPDHAHQHGIFSAWVRTQFKGRDIDFWNQLGGTGTVEHRRLLSMDSGDVWGGFVAEMASVDLSAPDGPQDILIEQWTVRGYPVGRGRLFEIESIQRCNTGAPLTILEYHYGGMAARGAAGWLNQPEHDFLTSQGLGRKDGNHTRPNWVSMHGLVQGAACGLTVFCHPDNFRSPQPVRLHPEKPYFVFSPAVLGEFQITPEQPYYARYLYLAYDGTPDAAAFHRTWNDYAHPPRVEWLK